MGATIVWPAVAVLGFLLFTGLVVALGASSTARYEFERNGAREPQHAPATRGAHPAGRRAPSGPAGAGEAPETQAGTQAVGLATRFAPAPVTGGPAWWLVAETALVVAGPFEDQVDAEWAALGGGIDAVTVYGARRADGTVAPRPSPQERSWLAELGEQLDRLPEDWDALLSDTDPLTTLVVEIAAALVEAGLPLHDTAEGRASGGVCLVPEPVAEGVVVGWRAHDRIAVQQVRGPAAGDAVAQLMNAAVADLLVTMGFVVEPFGESGSCLVTALR
ncbi:hypothetical protein [Blastococcus sp. TF02A-30]|uniref:hypothetical protein n=1 Tax=Blastococcus sp. TF02A-30 TaxID=2250580 RepID=UPI000DEAB8AF|nr:hypothetical protein [Blastococcus sp. TF02A-30]RBY84629.1 hypothetical protein DQ241_17350 [Blastococcus sp. TF02A-30]